MNIHKYMFSKRNFEGFIKKDKVGEMFCHAMDLYGNQLLNEPSEHFMMRN